MAALPMELTPIDWCARAIVALRNAPMSAFHIQSPAPPTVEDVARSVVPDLRILPDGEFERLMADTPVDKKGNLLSPLLDLWTQLKTIPHTVTVDSAATEKQLVRAGFTDAVPGPERLLRAFRFSPDERIK